MTKYFVMPVLFAFFFMCSSCHEVIAVILDDDTVCGEDVYTGYQPVSNHALEMTAALNAQTRIVFKNAAGEEMVLTLKEVREQKAPMSYKNLCYNASYNISQDEYCDIQMLDYIFVDAANNAEIWYSWYVDHSGEMIYDVFSTSVRVKNPMIGGSNTWVADNRGQQLPENLTTPDEWERTVGDTTMLGHSFRDVTYHNWGVNKGKGFFFQKGVGIVAIWAENEAFWVLDRVE